METKRYPTSCGVYIMKNEDEKILYIGKAKNLRARIRQYYSQTGDGRAMVPFLIKQVASIDTLLVDSEKEALLLENNLIKKHKPKYNALLKDDKSYLSLMVNHKDPWPMVRIVRYKGKPAKNKLYFGPFTNGFAAKQTLNLLRRLFPLRQCSDQELKRRTRPCILYDIKHCLAPCVGKCTKEQYDAQLKPMIEFLRGHTAKVVKKLYLEIEELSEKLEYERAKELLSTVRSIEKTVEKQKVEKLGSGDYDAFGIFREADAVQLIRLEIREGKLLAADDHFFANNAESDRALLESFIFQHYVDKEALKTTLLVPTTLENQEILGTLIQQKILVPKRGAKQKLIEMATRNAQSKYEQKARQKSSAEKILTELEEKLVLTNYPNRIECYDNSNISQTEPVGVRIVFEAGAPDKKSYRKYKLTHADDYGGFKEMLTRRFKSIDNEEALPDLIVIDGGKGQLNIAKRVLASCNISTVDLVSLCKEKGAHNKGLAREKIYLSTTPLALELGAMSHSLLFLQRVRDEAHRFAISFHRQRRDKKLLASELAEIAGLGPIKTKRLLKHFGSLKRVREASKEQLLEVNGMSTKLVNALLEWQKDEFE